MRWWPRPGNLIDRRGAALAPPVLLAVALNVAAVAGLAGIAGFHAVHASLTRIQWPWLCAVVAALAMSATGYYFAYRSIYAAEGGYQLSRRQLTAVVAAGFSGFFSTGGMRPDGLVLQNRGASRREAMVRVTALTGMEQAILALYGCAASIAWLSLGLPGVPLDFPLPWAVIPVSVFLDAVLLIRALFARPVRHRGAIGGMALFWAGDALAVWAGLAAFGFVMNGAALLVGYCTGMVFSRRVAPLAGAGTLVLILPLTIWASGAPLATAIAGVAAYRVLGVLSLPPALASLPVLRETTRPTAIARQALPGKRHRSASGSNPEAGDAAQMPTAPP